MGYLFATALGYIKSLFVWFLSTLITYLVYLVGWILQGLGAIALSIFQTLFITTGFFQNVQNAFHPAFLAALSSGFNTFNAFLPLHESWLAIQVLIGAMMLVWAIRWGLKVTPFIG